MSTTLTDLLIQFPNCRVTINTSAPRRKPCQGDRRWSPRKGWQVRMQLPSFHPNGRFEGYQTRNGRPRFYWVTESEMTEDQRYRLHVWTGAKDVTTAANRAKLAARQSQQSAQQQDGRAAA